MGNPHQRPERSELPAEEFGKLLDASNECHDQICILEGWLWWPRESWTEGLLSMPGDQPQKISHKSMNLMLVITTRLSHLFPTLFYAWNCSPGR